jgi:hypothetical protein
MYDSSAVQFVCLNSYRRTHSKKQKEAEKKKKNTQRKRGRMRMMQKKGNGESGGHVEIVEQV